MRILALSNAFQPSIVVFSEGEHIVFSKVETLPFNKPNNLLYFTNEMFKEVGLKKSDINLVSVIYGPGSFTGTRIGVVGGKMIAFALGVPIVPVNSLEYIAMHASGNIYSLLRAGKNEFFAARFEDGHRRGNDIIIKEEDLPDLEYPVVSPEEQLPLINVCTHIEPTPQRLIEKTINEYEAGNVLYDPLSLKPLYLHAVDVIFRKMKNDNSKDC